MTWLWIVAALVAYFIKGLCGFANTLVFTSILGFGTNNIDISPVELILGYPTNLIMAWENRKQINRRICIVMSLILLAGSIPGAYLLRNIDAKNIKIIFGLVVIVVAIEMFVREYQNKKTSQSKIMGLFIGILSGALCGMFGVGALMAAYVSRVTESSREFKANMSAIFIAENTFRIVLYISLGVITFSTLQKALLLMPFMLAGLWFGMKSSRLLDEKRIKKLVILMLILSGVVLIVKTVG